MRGVAAGLVVVALGLAVAALPGLATASGSSATAARPTGRVDPESVTFASARQGWALGTAGCGRLRCLVLLETTDAGSTWQRRPLPAALATSSGGGAPAGPSSQLNIRFADASDGWIYGEIAQGQTLRPGLWETHDGGRSWRSLRLAWMNAQSSVLDLEAAAGTVYAMSTNAEAGVTVESSPVTRDRWRRARQVRLGDPAGGGEQTGSFVLEGRSGWLVEGNDRGTTGSAQLGSGGRWIGWGSPGAAVGDSYAVPSVSADDMAAVCVMGGFASPLSPAAPPGARLGSSWLYLSHDGGRHFAPVAELGRLGSFVGPVAQPTTGVILAGRSASGHQSLEASWDGGRHWATVYRGGSIVFLGFTTPDQGVAIAQSPDGSSTFLMSFDGGRRWRTLRLSAR